MFDKESVEKILEGVVWLNNKMGVWSLIIPVVFAIAVLVQLYRSYKKPSIRNSRILWAIYAVIYLFGGYTIFMGKEFMGLNKALAGSIGLWSVSVFLVLDIIFKWTEIKIPRTTTLKFVSWFFIFAGIFLYPILEIALGFRYPEMVFFGAECPTTISLIGLLIGSIPKVNKPLFILISINAVATGGSVALSGATFDYLYALAGIFGVIMMIVYFKDIFMKKNNL